MSQHLKQPQQTCASTRGMCYTRLVIELSIYQPVRQSGSAGCAMLRWLVEIKWSEIDAPLTLFIWAAAGQKSTVGAGATLVCGVCGVCIACGACGQLSMCLWKCLPYIWVDLLTDFVIHSTRPDSTGGIADCDFAEIPHTSSHAPWLLTVDV